MSTTLKVDLNHLLNSEGQRKLFHCFREELITGGTIQWRLHEEEMDVVVLSDYDHTTGILIPCSFVHVTSIQNGDQRLVSCECSSYKLIQKAALINSNMEGEGDFFLEDKMTCMHCRFFNECLSELWSSLQADLGGSLLVQKATQSLAVMDRPALLIGDILPQHTTKLSVKGDFLGFVHLSNRDGRFWAKCVEGVCSAMAQNKSKHAKVVSLKKCSGVCSHLKVISENWEALQVQLPELFVEPEGEDEDQDEQGPTGEPEVSNQEDRGVVCEGEGVFDKASGLWNFPSFSVSKPREMNDPELVEYVYASSFVYYGHRNPFK